MAKIYVASSWRNKYQPEVVAALREAGHEVYDFRNPEHNPSGFHWADVDQNWQDWQPEEYIRNLTHPVAERGFKADLDAMLWADVCVLVLPCGRSAHTEAGWFAGKGLKTIVYMPEKQEPELMYKLFDGVVGSLEELIIRLDVPKTQKSHSKMDRIYIIPTEQLPPDTGYLEIMAMTEDDIVKLPHVTLTLSEFENEWNDDLKGQFDSTRQFIRVF